MVVAERPATHAAGRAPVVFLSYSRAAGDGGLVHARNDPMLDPLRSEPRFAGLLQGMGFDPPTASTM